MRKGFLIPEETIAGETLESRTVSIFTWTEDFLTFSLQIEFAISRPIFQIHNEKKIVIPVFIAIFNVIAQIMK